MENFIGSLALVASPEGEGMLRLGVINQINQNRSASLSFGDLSIRPYPLSEVLVLKNSHQLYQKLLTSTLLLDAKDFKTLLSVNMLQERGSEGSILKAMEILRDHPTAALHAADKLSSRLGLDQSEEQRVKMGGFSR